MSKQCEIFCQHEASMLHVSPSVRNVSTSDMFHSQCLGLDQLTVTRLVAYIWHMNILVLYYF